MKKKLYIFESTRKICHFPHSQIDNNIFFRSTMKMQSIEYDSIDSKRGGEREKESIKPMCAHARQTTIIIIILVLIIVSNHHYLWLRSLYLN